MPSPFHTARHARAFLILKADMATTTYTPPPWNYQGRELQRNPGIPDNRMHAYGLPSRVGKWLHYPDGRKELFPTKESTQ